MAATGRQIGTVRLPPSGAARLARFTDTTLHTSFLSVPSAAGLRTVGLEPVGDVMGCIATQIRHEFVGACSQQRTTTAPRVVLGANRGTRVSYVRVLSGAYRTALERLGAEARALGADGVVDIKLTRDTHEDLHEVVAMGTAVRARSRTRPLRPFTTDLSGVDVAKLMLSGWVPVTLHAAVQLGVRHNDYVTMNATGRMNRGNTEVTAYSELQQQVRSSAGGILRTAFAGAGADGGLLSDFRTTTWSTECLQLPQRSDHVACTVAIGTSIARFARSGQRGPAPLAILPVTPARTRS